jgi:RNA recognition motif-containing protein
MGKRSNAEPELQKKRKTSEETFIPLPSANTIEVIASGFPESITPERLQRLFKACGDFSISIPSSSKGVAFLKFPTQKAASKALELSGGTYKDHTLLINLTSDLPSIKREKPTVTPIFVGNLKPTTTVEQLQSFFSGAGKIKSIRVNTEKGFAHVDFTSRYSAQIAEKLAGGKLNGQRVRIEIADKKSS